MPNSTITLQAVIDRILAMGDMAPLIAAGGFVTTKALGVANDVMAALLAEPFNWKFNRYLPAQFPTISYQQDYASISETSIGWLEHASVLDVNNSQVPKPVYPCEAVRDLERSFMQQDRPRQICWLPNDQLQQDVWPGAGKVYTNPVGAVTGPANPPTNIKDANGNILVLTTYGTTGGVAPAAAANSAAGVTVADGSCVWTVADPKAQGYRLGTPASQTGVVYLVGPVAQKKPVRFANLQQTLDPVTDDFSRYFIDGVKAYLHNETPNPALKARFPIMQAEWLKSLNDARKQGDREKEAFGFYPDTQVMDAGTPYAPIGPAWPFGRQY